ncbi:D-alanine--D-alanine ligase family protein [Treponema sp.]|uniref:D-alanine--D-alanine ligase family protein n=1 Tax=Treponema sp. TaxID=166 RepID=UPI003EFE0A85
MNVVLLYGGKSGEHEISLLSCASVIRNISAAHNVSLISISKDGKWYLEDSSVFEEVRSNPGAALCVHEDESREVKVSFGQGKDRVFFSGGSYIPCDVVFPVLHGTYGEDGTVQGVFEMAGVPFAGCGTLASAAAMDKETAKILLKSAGIPVVPYVCLTRAQINSSSLYDSLIDNAVETLGFPLFVKPCAAGSSDGASLARNRKELSFALMEAFTWDNKVLIEKAVDAREVECSVTGNSVTAHPDSSCTVLKAYGPGEIVPTHDFYDYDAKYNDPDGAELKIPADFPAETLEQIRETAKKAYSALNSSGFARVDFFVDRSTGEIYLNEINTIPGFTKISMFPKMCEADGLDYSSLIDYLLEEGIENFNARQSLCTSR